MSSSAASITEAKVVPAPALVTLKGKVAIVTGASRGIGAGIALRLARDGAKVVINYAKDVTAANSVAAAINSIASGTAIVAQADISQSGDVDRLFAEAKRVFGRVDIVIANSGIAGYGTIAATSNDEFARVIGTNLTGTFYTLRAAANTIENNGRIIIMGSTLRSGLTPGYGVYSATKGAIEVLSNTLAQELGGRGITVNTVHPGGTATDMFLAAPKPVIDAVAAASPFKRIGTVADLGDAVALLVSESARWISGQVINVNGACKEPNFDTAIPLRQ